MTAAGGIVVEKYQTLGNCYLLLDPAANALPGDGLPPLGFVRRLCDPHLGIGSDGLLVGPERRPDGRFGLRILNSDGSRAEFSGNGSRIFARYLFDSGHAARRAGITVIAEDGGEVRLDAWLEGETPDGPIATEMAAPLRLGPEAVGAEPGGVVPLGDLVTVPAIAEAGRRLFGRADWTRSLPLSIGNPHCVTLVDTMESLPSFDALRAAAPALARIADAPAPGAGPGPFARGCNLQWAFAESRTRLHLRIVERGEGPTLASGSSASAAAVAAHRCGLVAREVTVAMPDGDLPVRLAEGPDGGLSIRLTAPVARIATCRLHGGISRD
jgi:diaminopimelate epimerase